MARPKGSNRAPRDLTNTITNDLQNYTPNFQPLRALSHHPVLALEDRRLFHPLKQARPAAATRTRFRRLLVTPTHPGHLSPRLKFAVPNHVAICARRKIRKAVLHALNKTGKGGSRRKPRHNQWSQVRC